MPLCVKGDSSILDECIYNWFVAAHARNLPVSRPMLQECAHKVAENLSLVEFKASNGWLESFHKCHNIAFHILLGKGQQLIWPWLKTLEIKPLACSIWLGIGTYLEFG